MSKTKKSSTGGKNKPRIEIVPQESIKVSWIKELSWIVEHSWALELSLVLKLSFVLELPWI